MGLKLSNNAISTLASGITAASTSIALATGTGSKFPTLGAGDYFPATISKSDGTFEIVTVTALSGDTLTVTRAQEGTTALSFSAGNLIELRLTAATVLAFANLTDVQTLTSKTIEAGTFTNGYTEEVATANTGTAYTINLANGSIQKLTLTGNCTYTFPTATAGRSFVLYQLQDATGSRTVSWPASVKWPSGTAPTLTSTASKADIFAFTADGTNWLGRTIGQAYL